MLGSKHPYIRCESGPLAGEKYDLGDGDSIFGRHPDCDIVLDLGAVSRQHIKVSKHGTKYSVEDLGSRNGSLLNDVQLKPNAPETLHNGDQIQFCGLTLLFCDPSATTRAPKLQPQSVLAGSEHVAPNVLLDESTSAEAISSTIMSKLDVSTSQTGLRLTASPEVKLAAMLEITQFLGNSVSLDQVLPQVLDALFKIFMQADRGFIVLRDKSGDLVPRWTKFRREDRAESVRISRTILDHVIEQREAILSKDAASDVRFEMSQSVADFQIRSMMCAPLLDSDGEPIGVIQVDTLDQRQRFRQEDLEVLASVASQAGIAIRNAQLHEQVLQQRELQRDLELSREVQLSFLPTDRPEVEGYGFFHYYEPANHVGGDYFDYVPLPDGELAVIVADVVGHGMAAALLMARLCSEVRSCLMTDANPGAAVSRLNSALSRDTMDDRFITLSMFVLDPNTGRIRVANAGHMPPLVCSADGTLTSVGTEASGVPLLIIDDFEYEQAEYTLQPGDLLVMYTDGINEASDSTGNLYGIERLQAVVRDLAGKSALEVGPRIIHDVHEHLAQQDDDMCLVVLNH